MGMKIHIQWAVNTMANATVIHGQSTLNPWSTP